MAEINGYAKAVVDVLGYVLCTIDGAVLAACAAERNLEVGEATVYPALGVEINERVDVGKELEYFAVLFQKVDDGLIESS